MFIKLTTSDGEPEWVKASSIIRMRKQEEGGTLVWFEHAGPVAYKATVSRITDLVKEATG